LLAGGGDLLDEVKRDLPSNLTVVGWQPATRMWAVADLAISTSENEGMPVALIEAQLAGIPVVGVDVGSVGEVVEDGKTGFVFAEFGEDYIKKVRELVLDEKQLHRLGSFAQERAAREFSPSALIKSHIEMFDEILRG
jgi:glycosyltransferase involved in cell wall biosynthesis